jgi:hypothetical protein
MDGLPVLLSLTAASPTVPSPESDASYSDVDGAAAVAGMGMLSFVADEEDVMLLAGTLKDDRFARVKGLAFDEERALKKERRQMEAEVLAGNKRIERIYIYIHFRHP